MATQVVHNKTIPSLVNRFKEAGLVLEILDEPIGFRGNSLIFQMDIQRKIKGNARTEYFRIYPGHPDNKIEVVGIDKNINQLVLMAHEERRRVEQEIGKYGSVPMGGKVIKEYGNGKRLVEWYTPDRKRHFLLGVDDRQLFVAQLPKACNTVREAHASLKNTDVFLYERENRDVKRQGEFFFMEPTETEKSSIEKALSSKVAVHKKVPLGPFLNGTAARAAGARVKQRGGNPHVVDELIVMPSEPLEHGHGVRPREIFIRGKVRHVDHPTVEFIHWRKVVRNTEQNEGRMDGVAWID